MIPTENNEYKIFSVIIPIHNSSQTLERCLASLISNKEYIKEVIIINDRSTDDYIPVMSPFRRYFGNDLKLFHTFGTVGPGPARKLGIQKATGKYITFVDSDDCMVNYCLPYVYNFLNEEENKNTIVLNGLTEFYENGVFNKDNVHENTGSNCGAFFLRDFLIENDLYPSIKLLMSEDEYYYRIITKTIDFLNLSDQIKSFDYPVYEVHHDIDFHGKSFANNSFYDYAIHYHSEYMKESCAFLLNKLNMRYNELEDSGDSGDSLEKDKIFESVNNLKNDYINQFFFIFGAYAGYKNLQKEQQFKKDSKDYFDSKKYKKFVINHLIDFFKVFKGFFSEDIEVEKEKIKDFLLERENFKLWYYSISVSCGITYDDDAINRDFDLFNSVIDESLANVQAI